MHGNVEKKTWMIAYLFKQWFLFLIDMFQGGFLRELTSIAPCWIWITLHYIGT
jgi:hypothetical protein